MLELTIMLIYIVDQLAASVSRSAHYASWNTNRDLHTPYSRVSFRMTSSDNEWLSEIFNDIKHRAVSLRQLSFLYCVVRHFQPIDFRRILLSRHALIESIMKSSAVIVGIECRLSTTTCRTRKDIARRKSLPLIGVRVLLRVNCARLSWQHFFTGVAGHTILRNMVLQWVPKKNMFFRFLV